MSDHLRYMSSRDYLLILISQYKSIQKSASNVAVRVLTSDQRIPGSGDQLPEMRKVSKCL